MSVSLRQDVFALDTADHEAREIIMPRRVHAWHLGRLAAHQRAARLTAAFCNPVTTFAPCPCRASRRKVVEEEQRLRALRQHVVDAHGHQIDPDRFVSAGCEGEHQLGADTIRTRNKHRVLEPRRLQVEQPAETAQRAIGARTARRGRQRLDRVNQRVAFVDVDASVAIGQGVWNPSLSCAATNTIIRVIASMAKRSCTTCLTMAGSR